MTHITRLAKSFAIAFFFSVFSANTWAQDPVSISGIFVKETGDGITIKIGSDWSDWMAFANGYNRYLDGREPGSTESPSEDITQFSVDGNIYDFDKIKNIILDAGYSLNNTEHSDTKPLLFLPEGVTLSMSPRCDIQCNGELECCLNFDDGNWCLLVNKNYGTIKNIAIKNTTIHIGLFQTSHVGNNTIQANCFSFIAAENHGTIENCEVVRSDISTSVRNNNEMNTIISAGIASHNYGTIDNCLVKDFRSINTNDDQPYDFSIYSAQIVGVDHDCNEAGKGIQNCCAFISNEEQITNTTNTSNNPNTYQKNYPLALYDLSDITDCKYSYNDIDESNKAFIVCATGTDVNIEMGDTRIVKYDASATDEDSNKFKDQAGLESIVKQFCDATDFDFIKYNFDDIDIETNQTYSYREKVENTSLSISLTLPKLHELYHLEKDELGRYIVHDGDIFKLDYCTMANMMANIQAGEEMKFVFKSSDDEEFYADGIPVHDVEVPSGCTIDACGAVIDVTYTNTEGLYPLFSKIATDATVKRLIVNVIYEITYNQNDYQINTIDPVLNEVHPSFGFLANENHGTIENCKVGYSASYERDGSWVETNEFPTNKSGSGYSIGGFVGINYGTIQNAMCGLYFRISSSYSNNNKLTHIGGIAGTNNGTITDAVFSLSNGLSGLSSPGQNRSCGIFVGYNNTDDDEYTPILERAFIVLSEDDITTADLETMFNNYTESGVPYRFKSSDGGGAMLAAGVGYALYSYSDKLQMTLLYKSGLVESYNEEHTSDPLTLADRYKTYSDADDEMATSAVLTNFIIPTKWGVFEGCLSLTMSDMDVETLTNQETGETIITSVNVGDNATLEEIVQKINDSPAVLNEATINITHDIDAERVMSLSLGTAESPYNGTLKGNGHAITNAIFDEGLYGVYMVPYNGGTNPTTCVPAGFFGSLGEKGVIENIELRDAVFNIATNDDEVKNASEITVGLLSSKNKGKIRNIVITPILNINKDDFNNTKINLALASDNGNDEDADSPDQASIENVVVHIKNENLGYKTYSELENEWDNMSENDLGEYTTFAKAYSLWCDLGLYYDSHKGQISSLARYAFGINDEDMVFPTFSSLVKWFNNGLTNVQKQQYGAIFTENNFNGSSLEPQEMVGSLALWYFANDQSALRIADRTEWNNYYESLGEGNHVCVIATQNLCKSPGKGRTRKVCAVRNNSGNKSTLLNPDDNVPATEMDCSAEQGANGYAAYWLNFLGEGYTGTYSYEWSNGLLYPILASAKNQPIVKIDYTSDDNASGVNYNSFGKQGSTVTVKYTNTPSRIEVDGVAIDPLGSSQTTFVIPTTTDAKGKVYVNIYFNPTGINQPATTTAKTIRIASLRNMITIAGAAGKHVDISTLQGTTVFAQTIPTDRIEVVLPQSGIYVVRAGNEVAKVLVR